MTEKEKNTVTELTEIAKELTDESKSALLRFGKDLVLIEKVKADADRKDL